MTKAETHKFGAEVEKIFHLMIHSLYQNKDIFLRELISNASDACDKLRYKSLIKQDLIKEGADLRIIISSNTEKGTITITDNGIGMSRSELIKNLGTIARSGTQDFLSKLKGDNKKDSELIGQFGVGFYSSFLVADEVTVISRPAGGKTANIWQSKGDGQFTIEEYEGEHPRGTSITLHIKDEEKEYLDKFRIKHIVSTYSSHTAFKIVFKEDDKEEVINEGKALWLKNKSEISAEDYKEFYQSVSHLGMDDPWLILHNKAEGLIEYASLLFIPSVKPFDLFHPERKPQVKLYVKRVFIADEGIDIIPSYLRFLRGIIDSSDLPLNISRETVQKNAVIHRIRKAITNRILDELKKKAEKEPEEYEKFWNNFGAVLKEGLCDGMEPRDEIIESCRFQTTESGGRLTSLKEYKKRMKSGQDSIYYLVADNEKAAEASPQLEGFKKRGLEVLLLTDSVDQFWVNVLHEYQKTPLKSVTRASTDLDKTEEKTSKEEKDSKVKEDKKTRDLIKFIKEVLGENVSDVRTTSRLTESPVCLTVPEGAMDLRMERFMVDNRQLSKSSAKILEINPEHPVIIKLAKDLKKEEMKEKTTDAVHLLFAQANIIEGEPVSDVKGFSRRLNSLLEKTLAA